MSTTVSASVTEALLTQATRFDFVLVPGFKDSGPEHWQSLWQSMVPVFSRITQRRWDDPDIRLWIAAILRHAHARKRPAVLIGHSLGALASACAAADGHAPIAGLMLVAPAEPARFGAEGRVPEAALGVPSLVVASQDDPVMRYSRAEHWARIWGGKLIDLGEAGHVNAEAGFGPWPYGLHLLAELAATL